LRNEFYRVGEVASRLVHTQKIVSASLAPGISDTGITMKHLTSALCLVVTAILVVSITSQKPTTVTPSILVTDGTPAGANIDWSMIGQAIAALISAIVGIVQLFRDLFGKTASAQSQPSPQLIRDIIQHGGTLTPTAETLGDDIVAFTNQTGSGPAYELAMRVAAEKLLAKYTITRKP
jgi:hypothetical protein